MTPDEADAKHARTQVVLYDKSERLPLRNGYTCMHTDTHTCMHTHVHTPSALEPYRLF
jgi:hypothetical protein